MDSEYSLSENDLDVIGEHIARMWFWSYYRANSLLDEDEEDIYDGLYD